MIGKFLGVGVGQPGEPAQVHSQAQVGSFDMGRGDMTEIGIASTDAREHSDHVTVVAVPFGTSVARLRENLGDLCEVNVCAVELFNGPNVALEGIGGELEPADRPAAQIAHERVGVDRIPSANVERENHLCVAVQCEPGVSVTPLGGRVGIQTALVATHKTPDFVSLNMPGPNAAHRAVKDSAAMLASIDHEAHDRVLIEIGEAGDRPDAHALKHEAEYLSSAIKVGVVGSERLGRRVGKRGFAGIAAVALDSALAVCSKLVGCIVLAADAGHGAFPLNWGGESGTMRLGLECGLPRVLDLAPPPVRAGDGALFERRYLTRRLNGDFYRVTCRSARDSNGYPHCRFRLSETAQVPDTRLGGSYLEPKLDGLKAPLVPLICGSKIPHRFGSVAHSEPFVLCRVLATCRGILDHIFTLNHPIDRGRNRCRSSFILLQGEAQFGKASLNLGNRHPLFARCSQDCPTSLGEPSQVKIRHRRKSVGFIAQLREQRDLSLSACDLYLQLFPLLKHPGETFHSSLKVTPVLIFRTHTQERRRYV
jgi:hypothetical protein